MGGGASPGFPLLPQQIFFVLEASGRIENIHPQCEFDPDFCLKRAPIFQFSTRRTTVVDFQSFNMMLMIDRYSHKT